MRPHLQNIMRNMHAKPLAELLDEPLKLNVADRHCMTTDDILKWGGGILRRRRVPRAPDNEESLESILARRPPAPLPPEQEPLVGDYDSEDW